MLLKTRHGVRRLRSGAVALTLTAFVPLAIPVTASASMNPAYPLSGDYFGYPQGNEFVNFVKADSQTNQRTVFKVRFGMGVGFSPTISAVNRAVALASQCADCHAIAIGFQVVTTTERDLTAIHALNVASASTKDCTVTCSAVADAYQVVVATDTPQPMSFDWLLGQQQLVALLNLRSEFLALPNSGLSLAQIQAECQDLVNEAVALLQDGNDGNDGGPGYWGDPSYLSPSGYGGPPSYPTDPSDQTLTRPAYSPAVHGADAGTQLTGNGEPVVQVYRDLQFQPFSAGEGSPRLGGSARPPAPDAPSVRGRRSLR